MESKSGFTIVELLIVIIVLGILSAISVAAYSGVQKRARDAQLVSGIEALEKGLRLYGLKQGVFPNPTDVVPSGGFTAACVQPTASGWPAVDGLTSSQCYALSSGGEVGYSNVLHDALRTVMNDVPDTSSITYSVPGVLSARGLIYQYWSTDRVGLAYFIPISQDCVRGVRNAEVGDLAQCFVEIKAS